MRTGHRGGGISVSLWVGFPMADVRRTALSGVRVAGRHHCPHPTAVPTATSSPRTMWSGTSVSDRTAAAR